jgi:hypothetical protein
MRVTKQLSFGNGRYVHRNSRVGKDIAEKRAYVAIVLEKVHEDIGIECIHKKELGKRSLPLLAYFV